MPKHPGFNLLVGGLLLMALTLQQVAIAQAGQPSQRQPSAAAQKALAYIAAREGIPNEALIIWADYPTEYPHLGQKFQVVTLLDARPRTRIYKLLVDLENEQVLPKRKFLRCERRKWKPIEPNTAGWNRRFTNDCSN